MFFFVNKSHCHNLIISHLYPLYCLGHTIMSTKFLDDTKQWPFFHILLLTNHKLRFVTFTHSSRTFYYDGSKMVSLVEVREVWLTGMRCNYKSGQPNTEPNVQDLYFYVWQYFVVGLCQPFLFLLSPTTMTTIIDSLFRAVYWTLPTEMQISFPFFVLPQIPRHAKISAASYNKLDKPFLRHR